MTEPGEGTYRRVFPHLPERYPATCCVDQARFYGLDAEEVLRAAGWPYGVAKAITGAAR